MLEHVIDVKKNLPQPTPGLPMQVFAFGFSFRKRAIVRQFIGNVKVRFIRQAKYVSSSSALLLWGSDPAPDGLPPDIQIIRMEDGFLRSVGLGADLIHPVSWVIDRRGIYYDATKPSDLEYLLQTTQFSTQLLERAACLRHRIVDAGLSKYNVGSGSWLRPRLDARVILVPGQVETDASIQFGAPGIASNLGLLKAVRQANPDAYVLYKPHPDVVAGLRAKGHGEDKAECYCDAVITDVAISDLLCAVDEVHVLTSLTGFEALLRGKKVICYGQPFYAGWGLTQDVLPVSRRTRDLQLDALVAGALILYPTYISKTYSGSDAVKVCLSTPEQALDDLLAGRAAAACLPWWSSVLRHLLRATLQIMLNIRISKR